MRIVIQRVKRASVSVEEKVVGSIQKGFLVLIGVGQGDDEATADKYMKKLLGLRIFEDENGKIIDCTLCQKWPIKQARPVSNRLPISIPVSLIF